MKGLGPDNIIDYSAKDAQQQLEQHGKYVNIIFCLLQMHEFDIINLIFDQNKLIISSKDTLKTLMHLGK